MPIKGVTFLAFGNGCSDIFTAFAGASSGRPDLIVSELLGAGIFCLSIVAGLVFIHKDFRLAYRPLLRDTIFYLVALYYTWYICWAEQITFFKSLGKLVLEATYMNSIWIILIPQIRNRIRFHTHLCGILKRCAWGSSRLLETSWPIWAVRSRGQSKSQWYSGSKDRPRRWVSSFCLLSLVSNHYTKLFIKLIY